MDGLDQGNYIFDGSFRQDPMSQVENVTRFPGCLFKNLLRLLADVVFACEQCHWIEISHYGDVVSKSLPCLIQSQSPIKPDYIATGFLHQFK